MTKMEKHEKIKSTKIFGKFYGIFFCKRPKNTIPYDEF